MKGSGTFARSAIPVAVLCAVALLFAAAPATAKTVGMILPQDCAYSPDTREKFSEALREQGFSTRDLEIFMQRPGSDKVSRLNSIRKFLAIGTDVIVVWGGTSLKEIASEAGKTPIVFLGVWDPVKSGIVKDLNAPGRNITGISGKTSMPYIIDNVIETAAPKTLGVIYHSDVLDSMAQYDELKGVAASKGLDLLAVDAVGLSPAAAAVTLGPAEFLYLAQGCDVIGGVYSALEGLNKPAATQNPGVSGGGVIFTLAPDMEETLKVAAEITGSILKGQNPGTIPVARIKKISFTINMGEAQKLGVKVPFGVLNRATEVIR